MNAVLEIVAIATLSALALAATFLADNDRRRTVIGLRKSSYPSTRPWRWTLRDRSTGDRLQCGTARTRLTAWLTAYTTVVDDDHATWSSVTAIADGHPSIPVDELAARRTARSRHAHPSGRTPA